MVAQETAQLRGGVLRLLALMQSEERRFEDELPDDERSEVGIPDRWGAKATLAHITDFKREQVTRLEAALDGSVPPDFPPIDHGDAAVYAGYIDRPWAEVVDDRAATTQTLHDRTSQLDDDHLSTPGIHSWLHGRALWAQILVRGVWHPSAHLHQHLAEHDHLERLLDLQRRIYETATEAGIPDVPGGMPFAAYNLACAHALADQTEPALAYLAEAVRNSPTRAEAAKTDPDLERIRRHPRFSEIVAGVPQPA